MNDPVIGRPEISNSQYNDWLDELRPFLKMGESLNSAIEDAGLNKHRTILYEKYREKGDFTHAVDVYREHPGKLANNILIRLLFEVDDKIKRGIPPTPEDMKTVRFVAEKHRSAQTYFTNRQETAEVRSIEDVISELDNDADERQEELSRRASLSLEKTQPEAQTALSAVSS